MRMSEQEKKGLVPVLRFPEFQNNGEWEVKEIGEVFDVTRGYVLSMGLVSEVYSETAPYPVYSSQTKNNGLAGYYSEFLYENAITWTTDGANAGDVNYRKGKFYCTNVCGVIINDQGFANPCIAALLNSVTRKYVSYVGNPKLMNGVMSKIKIPFPTLEEQQKIADCLTFIDELITAQIQKLDAFKTHKKGLMQQLFPAEGETVPKIRFPEFRNKGEWKMKSLGELVEVASGQVDPTELPYCNMLHIGGENIESHTGNLKEVRAAMELGLISGKYLFDKRDVLYSKIRPALNKVTIPDFQGICSADIYPIRPANQELCRQYLAYLLLCEDFLEYAIRHSDRSKIPKLNRDSLLTYKLVIPCRLEQQRIADCLTSVDDLITAQTQKLNILKTHKKGLMQQLFPAIDDDCMDDKAGVSA